jgi:type IV secretory pathway VirD2 relaxase
MADLRAFTRELLEDMASDLDTSLDWVAVDHWNTDNPHVHVLVRGVASDGRDLVIDRSYISEGMRARAQERVTIELGPRSERDIQLALRREVDAERWTSLDRRLQKQRDDLGVVDLSPEVDATRRSNRAFLIGRARTLERMGLAERIGAARWTLAADLEPTLRALGERGDIIKTLHKAMSERGVQVAPAAFALHGEDENRRVIGRLVERGFHNELTGEAYAIVEGVDGRAHYLRFPDLDQTSDAAPGAIVETGEWTDRNGRRRSSLLVRSDLPLERQIDARGATWLDRQLLSARAASLGGGFGNEVRKALDERRDWLVDQGLAKRHGRSVTLVRNLLGTLRKQELDAAGKALAARHGRLANPVSALCHLLVVVQLRSLCAAHLRDRRNDCRIGRSRVGGGRDRHVGLARPRDQEQRDLWLGALGDPFRNITRGPSGRQGRHYRPACQSLSSSRRARTCALLRTDAQRQRCRPCRPDAADLAPLGDRA